MTTHVCRWSTGCDVSVREARDGGWACEHCSLAGGTVHLEDLEAVIVHLREHHHAGHSVPRYAWTRVIRVRGRGKAHGPTD